MRTTLIHAAELRSTPSTGGAQRDRGWLTGSLSGVKEGLGFKDARQTGADGVLPTVTSALAHKGFRQQREEGTVAIDRGKDPLARVRIRV